MGVVTVWDAETDRSFKSMRGMPREQQMQLMEATVVCAIELQSSDSLQPGNGEQALRGAKEHHWWRDEPRNGERAFASLLDLFDRSEVIVAYNGLGFDFPVMRKYYGSEKSARRRYIEHRLKTLDPMIKIAAAADVPYQKLDALLKANALTPKTGDGLEAIKLWEEGRRGELKEYCAHDVRQLAHIVHLSKLSVPGVGLLPNCVHGIASAILAQRALQPEACQERARE